MQLPIVILKILMFLDMHHHKTNMYINFAKNCKLHKFITCNKNFIKSHLSDMHHPIADIQANLEMNRPTRYEITAKRNY